LVGLVFLLFLFSACGVITTTDDVAAAIADGVILPQGRVLGSQQDLDLVAVRRGDIERTVDLAVSARFSVMHNLSFERPGGLYSGAFAATGERVQEGDVLGEQFFPESITEPLNITRNRVVFQIETFEERFARERASHAADLEEARRILSISDDDEAEIAALRLARLELLFEQFLFQNQLTRRNFQRQLDDIDAVLNGERIYAPFDGILTAVSHMNYGAAVPLGFNLFSIVDERHIYFRVIAPNDVMRPGSVHTIMAQDYELFFCARVISVQADAGPRVRGVMTFKLVSADNAALAEALEILGLTHSDLVGMELRLISTETLVYDALILPSHAIRQEDLAEYVLVYEDGRLAKRYISRGLQYRTYVQILMGVEEGRKVALR